MRVPRSDAHAALGVCAHLNIGDPAAAMSANGASIIGSRPPGCLCAPVSERFKRPPDGPEGGPFFKLNGRASDHFLDKHSGAFL